MSQVWAWIEESVWPKTMEHWITPRLRPEQPNAWRGSVTLLTTFPSHSLTPGGSQTSQTAQNSTLVTELCHKYQNLTRAINITTDLLDRPTMFKPLRRSFKCMFQGLNSSALLPDQKVPPVAVFSLGNYQCYITSLMTALPGKMIPQ